MKLFTTLTATAFAVALIVPATFAATTHGTLAAKSHVAAMKSMKHGKKMGGKKAGKKMGGKKMGAKKGGKKMAGMKMTGKKMSAKKA